MNQRLKGAAPLLMALAAALLLGAPAQTPVINAGSLRMTGMAMDPVTVNAESLTMTGMALDPVTIDAGSLRMTGQASTRPIIKVVKPLHTR